MEFWIKLWTIIFVVGLGIFTLLAIAVSIGGYFNIRSLFKSIESQHGPQENNAPPEPNREP